MAEFLDVQFEVNLVFYTIRSFYVDILNTGCGGIIARY